MPPPDGAPSGEPEVPDGQELVEVGMTLAEFLEAAAAAAGGVAGAIYYDGPSDGEAGVAAAAMIRAEPPRENENRPATVAELRALERRLGGGRN